jgi:hypothetical protein
MSPGGSRPAVLTGPSGSLTGPAARRCRGRRHASSTTAGWTRKVRRGWARSTAPCAASPSPPAPAQQPARCDQPPRPQRAGEQPGQGSEYRPVGPVQLRPGMLPPEHRDLVAQHKQLSVLRRRRARRQRQPSRQADEHQVENPNCHKPAMLPARRLVPQENPQVNHLRTVLKPHRANVDRDKNYCGRAFEEELAEREPTLLRPVRKGEVQQRRAAVPEPAPPGHRIGELDSERTA